MSVRQLSPQNSVELKVSHLHVLCPLGILLVLVYRQSPTSLIGEPQGRRGWGPSLGALTMLAWGRRGSGLGEAAEVRPHARGSRLVVYTELFVYVGESRRSCQIFISVGAPLGPDLGGGPELPTATRERLWGWTRGPEPLFQVVQNPYSLYYLANHCKEP